MQTGGLYRNTLQCIVTKGKVEVTGLCRDTGPRHDQPGHDKAQGQRLRQGHAAATTRSPVCCDMALGACDTAGWACHDMATRACLGAPVCVG